MIDYDRVILLVTWLNVMASQYHNNQYKPVKRSYIVGNSNAVFKKDTKILLIDGKFKVVTIWYGTIYKGVHFIFKDFVEMKLTYTASYVSMPLSLCILLCSICLALRP